MTQDQTHTDGSRIDSTTRRGALAALGGAGLLAALGGSAQADVGGGPESDELAHLLSRFYEGPEDELPEPGVEGRRFLVTDAGGQYSQWSLLRDQGDAWAKVDLNVGSVGAEGVNNRVYASETLGNYPNIQEALDSLDWGGEFELVIIGGENIVSDTIEMPDVGFDDETQHNNGIIRTSPDSVIKQADGADLDILVDNQQNANLDVNLSIDGNQSNNSTDVVGYADDSSGIHQSIRVRVKDAETGAEFIDATRQTEITVFAYQCGTGLRVTEDGGHTLHESEFRLFSWDNDIGFHNVNGGVFLEIYAQRDSDYSILNESTMFATGTANSGGGTAVKNEGRFHADRFYSRGNIDVCIENTSEADDCTLSNSNLNPTSGDNPRGIIAHSPVKVTNTSIRNTDVGVELYSGADESEFSHLNWHGNNTRIDNIDDVHIVHGGHQYKRGDNVTNNREFDERYQNTSEHMLNVFISVELESDGKIDTDTFVGPIEDNLINATDRAGAELILSGESGDIFGFEFDVPPGQYYEVRDNNDNLDISLWREKEATFPDTS